MRANNVIILFVAIVLGGLAALLARNWLVSHAQPTQQANQGAIVVAATPLAFGAELTGENLKEIPWSTDALPDGAFLNKQEVLKDGRRMVLTSIARNEPEFCLTKK